MPLPDQDVRGESDEDLLVYMSWKDQAAVAKAACNEFYTRHVKYVFAVIQRNYGSALGERGVEDMVTETFVRVIEKAGTYKPCGAKELDQQRRNALAWVGAIAKNLCRDHFRRPDTQLVLGEGEWTGDHDGLQAKPPVEATVLTDDLKSVHEAMELLSERDRTVLRVTMDYWEFGREHQRLPNDIVEDLARSFDTSSENIRKIRERAMRHIEKHVEASRKLLKGEKP